MRRRSCMQPAELGWAGQQRTGAPQEDPARKGTQSSRLGGGTAIRTHPVVTRASCSVGQHRDFMCL